MADARYKAKPPPEPFLLENLPDNVFDEVLSYLSYHELGKLRSVDRKFNSTIKRLLNQDQGRQACRGQDRPQAEDPTVSTEEGGRGEEGGGEIGSRASEDGGRVEKGGRRGEDDKGCQASEGGGI